MIVLRIFLFPLAVLYNMITGLRNRLYDRGLRPSVQFDVPVICVGNLTVGGTGKTPMIEHLIRLLTPRIKVATLSRGYGRQSKGLRFANEQDSAATLGDEPFQFYKKFGSSAVVTVGEDRAFAIPNILQEHADVGVILLDDGFQHRRVRPSLSILLSDYHRPFYEDFVLPAGRLRESRTNVNRADIVIITKCPRELSDDDMMDIERSVRLYADKPVFFSAIRYSSPIPFGKPDASEFNKVILVTGVASAKPLVEYVKSNFTLVDHIEWGDHHTFSGRDIAVIQAAVGRNPGAVVVTTEKDMVKLISPELRSLIQSIPFFYIPIEVQFIKNGEEFDAMVLNSVHRDV